MLLTSALSWTLLTLSVRHRGEAASEEQLVVAQHYYEVRNMSSNASTGCYYAADSSNAIFLLNNNNVSTSVSSQTVRVTLESSQSYYQVLYQTSASSSGDATEKSVDVLLQFMSQQIQKYLMQSCTEVLLHQGKNQSLPYYRLRQTTQYYTSIFALTSSVTAAQNITCSDYDDNDYYPSSSSAKISCFVMEQNISFYCHGTCSTQTKLSIHDSLLNSIVHTNSTQIDWETATVLRRIQEYTSAYSKIDYKMGDNSTSLRNPTNSNATSSTITLLVQILPGIVILLFAMGSIFLVKKIRKKTPKWDNLLPYEETNSNTLVTDINRTESIDEVKSVEFSLASWISQTTNPIQQNMHFLQEGAPSTLLPDGNYAVEIGKEPKPTIDAYFHQNNKSIHKGKDGRYMCTGDKNSIQNWFQYFFQKPLSLHFGCNSEDEEEEEEGSSAASSFEDSSLELSLEDYNDTITMVPSASQTTLSMISSTLSIPIKECEEEAEIAPYDELQQLESPKSVADPRSLHQQSYNHPKSQSPPTPSILKKNDPVGLINVDVKALPKKKGKRTKVSFILPEERQNSSSSVVIDEEERIEIFYNAGSKSVLAAFISK